MSTTLNFKGLIDLPKWRPLSAPGFNALVASAAGSSVCSDLRNSEDRNPFQYYLVNATTLYKYHIKNDGWNQMTSPALAGTFGVGASCVFAPSHGPRGTIAAGATASSIPLTTALPAAVVANQLANRGDGIGFKVRIVSPGNGATAEAYITANTGGLSGSTTPTLSVSTTWGSQTNLPFTPATGDTYEFLSGRLYLLSAGTLAAGCWKAFDIATNSLLANLATTNMPATINTDSSLVCLDELYTPATQAPGAGYFGNLVATGTAAGTITGQATGGDAGVALNEYRNFQIRIITDGTNKTAVGQRRIITSHTAGASPVYTLTSNWTVTPSSTATYVIENPNWILMTSSGSTNTYSYAAVGLGGIIPANTTAQAADTWSTSSFAARGTASGAGTYFVHPFGITLDAGKNSRYSYIYSLRGGNSSAIDVLDIAGATTGSWTSAVAFGGQQAATTFNTGTSGAYDGATNSGMYAYINMNGSQSFLRLDCLNRVIEPFTVQKFVGGAAITGCRMCTSAFIDGATKLGFLTHIRSTGTDINQIALHR